MSNVYWLYSVWLKCEETNGENTFRVPEVKLTLTPLG